MARHGSRMFHQDLNSHGVLSGGNRWPKKAGLKRDGSPPKKYPKKRSKYGPINKNISCTESHAAANMASGLILFVASGVVA